MGFINSPLHFKPKINRLTEYRIKLVMRYVAYCYLEMAKDSKTYDFSKLGKLQKEDYLRNGLVDDYLSRQRYKNYYKSNISDNPLVEIYFQKEENQVYSEGVLADDYIDISVKETKLSEILSGESEDEIKFAIECKRINTAKDYVEYVKDIQKFADRPFTTYRLPFEGQIAFIENNKLNHQLVSNGVNSKLKPKTTISTTKYLDPFEIHEHFAGSYSSGHKRNYYKQDDFSIFHLLLDYSKIVIS